MAGDALQSEAFYLLCLLGTKKINHQDLCHAMMALTHAIGPKGMAGGQTRDILDEAGKEKTAKSKLLKKLHLTHMQKTGALIEVSLLAPLHLFKSALPTAPLLEPLTKFSQTLGLAFQIVDDILDETSDTKTLGKSAGSDIKNSKKTFTTLLGIEKSRNYLLELDKKILSETKKIESAYKKTAKKLNEKKDMATAPNIKAMFTGLWKFVVKRNH